MPDKRVLPCTSCGKPACTVELPTLEPKVVDVLMPLVKLGAWQLGIKLDPAISSTNPLAAIPTAAIAELLAVKCASCTAAIAADTELQAVA